MALQKVMKDCRFLILVGFLAGRTALATTYYVQAGYYYFSPATLSIGTGDSVNWTLESLHTSTSAASVGSCYANRLWDSAGSNSFTYTFPTAGTFPYFC